MSSTETAKVSVNFGAFFREFDDSRLLGTSKAVYTKGCLTVERRLIGFVTGRGGGLLSTAGTV